MQMNEQELRKLNRDVAEKVFGWELIDLDYYEMNKKPGFVLCRSGSWNKPSVEKWEHVLEREQINGVGEYWVDPKTERIICPEMCGSAFSPATDKASSFEVLRWCAVRCAVVTFKRIDGSWEAFKSGENCVFGVGPTLEIALCRFALELAGRGK